MTGKEALILVDRLLETAKGQTLNDIQSEVLRQTWDGNSYQAIADDLGYEVDYIKQIAARLWKLIAQAVGENASKRNIQSVLRRYQESHPVETSQRIQDWGEAIDVSHFYGRQADLQTLETWLLTTRCRLIGIFGLGGIGKTTLSVKLAQNVQSQFEVIIWRSLRQTPLLNVLLNEILPILTSSEAQKSSITALMEQLRQKRCLLVLDNVESILQPGNRSGQYKPAYEVYSQLFERIGDESHQSCLILTGREKPGGIAVREGKQLPVRSLKLQGLAVAEGQQILVNKGLEATATQYQALVNYFGGNPLALKLAATTIQNLFNGNIQAFLAQGTTVFSSLWDLLEQQFQRLSLLQQQVMYWLAINREGVTAPKLQAEILPKVPLRQLLETLEVLQGRSLIETTETGLTQQPVIMEYVTEHFIETIEGEIIQGEFNLLNTHALIEAQTQDYLREAQIQLILHPLAERLLTHFSRQSQLENHLRNLLTTLRKTASHNGYAGGNLLNLFCQLKTDLKGFDFSGLTIRQANLHNVLLHDADFTGVQISQTVFAETFGGVVGVAFSPDGQRLATSDTKGDIGIWDARTGEQQVRCRGHQHWTWAVAFSPDGRYLASASDDYRVKLWDSETGQCIQTYEGHTYSVNAVAFSPDGNIIASCSQDSTIRFWQVAPARINPEIKILKGHKGRIWAIAFSPDGQTLVSGGEDCLIRLWDVSTGICHHVWQAHEGWVRSLAYSPDGQFLASSSYDHTINLWDRETRDCLRTLRGHRQPVTAIAFSPGGQYLVSSSFDHTVKLWDTTTGECLKTHLGHTSRVWTVAFHPNGQQVVSGGDDHATKIWNLKTGRCTKTLVGHTNAVLSLALSPNQHYLASGHEDHTIRLWDLKSGAIAQTLREHTNRVWSVAFSSTNEQPLLASGSADYTIKLWDWQSGICQQTLLGHSSWVWTVIFSPDATKLASSSYDQTVKLWDISTGECLNTLQGHTSSVVSVAFSPDGQLLASGEFDGVVKLWDVETGECCQTLKDHSNSVWSITFSPNGEWLISSSFDQTLKLWSVTTGKCLKTFVGHQGAVLSAQFSPDGQFVVSGSLDRTLKCWDILTGQCCQTLVGHSDLIYAVLVAFLPVADRNSPSLTVFSGSLDESIKVWDIQSQECLLTWRSPRPYEDMKIKGIQGLTEAQLATLKALGAIE